MMGWYGFSGVEKLGTRQIPFLRMFCQSSPSWISPLTPIFSMIKPFSLGREGSISGMVMAGVGVGLGVGLSVGLRVGQIPFCDGLLVVFLSWMTVEAIVEASASEV